MHTANRGVAIECGVSDHKLGGNGRDNSTALYCTTALTPGREVMRRRAKHIGGSGNARRARDIQYAQGVRRGAGAGANVGRSLRLLSQIIQCPVAEFRFARALACSLNWKCVLVFVALARALDR